VTRAVTGSCEQSGIHRGSAAFCELLFSLLYDILCVLCFLLCIFVLYVTVLLGEIKNDDDYYYYLRLLLTILFLSNHAVKVAVTSSEK